MRIHGSSFPGNRTSGQTPMRRNRRIWMGRCRMIGIRGTNRTGLAIQTARTRKTGLEPGRMTLNHMGTKRTVRTTGKYMGLPIGRGIWN
jgi:hypothetical protein